MPGSVMIEERFKDFPPGWGHIAVPTSGRGAALAGLAMYSACTPKAILAQRVARAAVRLFGARALPGAAVTWQPPAPPDVWEALCDEWRRDLGAFDTLATYHRVNSRAGVAMLLISNGRPVAFVKLRGDDASRLEREGQAARAVWAFQPRTFVIPQPLTSGAIQEWHYLAVSALPSQPHLPATNPPLEEIVEEIASALESLPRASDTPAHWRGMHGDFTPWNLRQIASTRYLIDWEDASFAPPGADRVLYEATDAALKRGVTPPRLPVEAVEYWMRRVEQRPAGSDREKRLRDSLMAALRAMV
jgi:hypothetical protein